ncbi:MAG: hypothetical protein GF387_01955 [Candidatus Portnoybacteria bacterium]|nr:hypothetical protein [Candidatus Portnoybacteria bacterium]
MIDSITFQLSEGQFEMKKYNKLDGLRTQRGKGFLVSSQYCEQYAKEKKKEGIYFPVITFAKRKAIRDDFKEVLEIQFSLPKLIYGTNLFEVDINDLNKIYENLLSKLDEIGIKTSSEKLEKAILKKVDFSKVIKLPDYLGTADFVINKLLMFNYKFRSQFKIKEYSNGKGVCLSFYNTSQRYTIYDKFGEIYNLGYTNIEKKLTNDLKEGIKRKNALKFELSIQRKDSLEALLRRRINDKEKDFLLKDILKNELARDVLLDIFNEVFGQPALGLVCLSEMEENRLLAYLDKTKLTLAKQHKLYYWSRMTTKFGIAGTWEQLRLKCKGGSFATNKKEIALIIQELGKIDGYVPNLIEFLRAEHNTFNIIKPQISLEGL